MLINMRNAMMAGGVTTFDAMMPYVTNQLPKYENDAVVVSAMREAMHHNLYALANSSGMNGVGANTTILPKTPMVITICMILACGGAFFTLICGGLWIFGAKRLRKSREYYEYKTAKREYKASRKA